MFDVTKGFRIHSAPLGGWYIIPFARPGEELTIVAAFADLQSMLDWINRQHAAAITGQSPDIASPPPSGAVKNWEAAYKYLDAAIAVAGPLLPTDAYEELRQARIAAIDKELPR